MLLNLELDDKRKNGDAASCLQDNGGELASKAVARYDPKDISEASRMIERCRSLSRSFDLFSRLDSMWRMIDVLRHLRRQRMSRHHRLRIAATRRAAMLLRRIVMRLMRATVVRRLVRLRERASHGRHYASVSITSSEIL